MNIRSFEDLEAWKLAHALALEVYRASGGFPPAERFGLVPQIRRAAVSVSANLAEGFGRATPADKARCYTIASGSLEEVGCFLLLARDLGWLPAAHSLFAALAKTRGVLRGLLQATRNGAYLKRNEE